MSVTMLQAQNSPLELNPYLNLMTKAAAHAAKHGAPVKPTLSPVDATVLNGSVPVAQLKHSGFRVVPWTTNDPEKMRAIIRMEGDGLISDRPDLLQQVLAEERESSPESREQLKSFNVSGHRGARGLRPENTLPAFEAGLDNLIDTIETDTGVTSDHVSLIWHDQFLSPQSCRKADGSPYSMENRVYIRDVSIRDAQTNFICDKLHFGPDQTNDLALSPVSVAFAEREHLISPYVPTYVEQLFRFTGFYGDYYRNGPGKAMAHAKERADASDRVQFNLETKILPENLSPQSDGNLKIPADMLQNHTVEPQVFVDTLCGVIRKNKMQPRSDVQSFDFRTLILVEEQYPEITTYYLTESPAILATEFVPATLRAAR
ncbi:MAG TPA: glycerophosphodiester phosphodiesterase family protein [Acidobacteriaceae bacterium]|jgi:glycerophosphoryl diester phosphodiesterase|nr:glycerophosphodiester phosphodiesterase family protein [Acidobacteriaceae bacterium]